MGEKNGQWHCPGREEEGEWEKGAGNGIALKKEEGEWEKWAGNGIALKRKKQEIGRNERATALPWKGRKRNKQNETQKGE